MCNCVKRIPFWWEPLVSWMVTSCSLLLLLNYVFANYRQSLLLSPLTILFIGFHDEWNIDNDRAGTTATIQHGLPIYTISIVIVPINRLYSQFMGANEAPWAGKTSDDWTNTLCHQGWIYVSKSRVRQRSHRQTNHMVVGRYPLLYLFCSHPIKEYQTGSAIKMFTSSFLVMTHSHSIPFHARSTSWSVVPFHHLIGGFLSKKSPIAAISKYGWETTSQAINSCTEQRSGITCRHRARHPLNLG